MSDQLGSVRLVVNIADASDVLFAANYAAFGSQEVLVGTSGVVPFGFAGGMFDDATGWVRFGARDYDAEVGRWTAKDPVRWDGGQANLYGYTANDPISFVDPFGLGRVCNDSSQMIYVKDEHLGVVPVPPGKCWNEADGFYQTRDNQFTDAAPGDVVRKINDWTDIRIWDDSPNTCGGPLNWGYDGLLSPAADLGQRLWKGEVEGSGWKDKDWADRMGFPSSVP